MLGFMRPVARRATAWSIEPVSGSEAWIPSPKSRARSAWALMLAVATRSRVERFSCHQAERLGRRAQGSARSIFFVTGTCCS